MGNKNLGEIVVCVDGADWTMVCDFNALCLFEAETGRVATEFLHSMENDPHPAMVPTRAFVWACLKRRHAEVTLEQAGDVMTTDPEALTRALQLAFPDPPGDSVLVDGEVPAPGEK